MIDDQHDEMLQGLAEAYHPPPPTPREEIWARIQEARATPETEPQVLPFRPRIGSSRSPMAQALIWVTGDRGRPGGRYWAGTPDSR